MITLPWPHGDLNPNTPGNWRKKAKARADYKSDCYFIALANKRQFPPGKIGLYIVFCPPNKSRRDLDNLLACMKNGLDGVAKAWGIDDSRFCPITIDLGEPVKNGAVKVVASPASNEQTKSKIVPWVPEVFA